MENKLTAKAFAMNVLNGIAAGVVVVLIPGALLLELTKALSPSMPFLAPLIWGLSMSNSAMGLVCGFMAGLNFKFTPIQSASLGLATLFASGGISAKDGLVVMQGTGDIITMMVTVAIGSGLILLVGNRLKAYTILLIPPLMLLVVGLIGRMLLPHISMITKIMGVGIAQLLTLQPLLMCMLLAIVFGLLIVSPFTTVGIALAISLTGLGSGAANVGICATGFAFAILGWSVNTHGTALAHFLGSAKISMPVWVRNPKTLLPIICSSAVCGLAAYGFQIQGTPMSAGFGFSGFVGPITHLNLVEGGWTASNLIVALLAFVVFPVVFGFVFKYLFVTVLKLVTLEDYKLDI